MTEHTGVTIAGAMTLLAPAGGNEPQIRKLVMRGTIGANRGADGAISLPMFEVIRALLLLDLQRTLGPTNGLAADVVRALTPLEIAKLFNAAVPEIRVRTDNGIVVFMPDPKLLATFRDRLLHFR